LVEGAPGTTLRFRFKKICDDLRPSHRASARSPLPAIAGREANVCCRCLTLRIARCGGGKLRPVGWVERLRNPSFQPLHRAMGFAALNPSYKRRHPRLMNERAWFGKIVASYKFISGGSEALSTATLATSAGSMT